VLVIRRTLAEGRWHGLLSGLGAATADGIYGTIAAFGLTALTTLLVDNVSLLRIAGGLFLLYLGVKTLLAKPAQDAAEVHGKRGGLIGAYTSTFILTLTNPMTIFAFLGIFAGIGFADVGGDVLSGSVMVLGVFIGSAFWWLLLSGGVMLLRNRFSPRIMLWVNRLSGAIIILFALNILLGIF